MEITKEHEVIKQPLRVLLVEDDEEDFVLTNDLLAEITTFGCDTQWAATYAAAKAAITEKTFDICLVDYRLGERTGLELLREAVAQGFRTPMILLTGQDDRAVDIEAMNAGAADYLIKGKMEAAMLERAIRFAVERRRAEEAFEKDGKFLEAVLDNMTDGLVACNAEGKLTLFNRAAQEMHGLPVEQLAPEHWAGHYDLYQADGLTPMSRDQIPLFRALQAGTVSNVEIVIAPKNKKPRTVIASGQSILDAQGRKLGAVVGMHDISERKLSEQLIQQSKEKYQNILEAMQDGYYEVDLTGRMVFFNEILCGFSGYSKQEFTGMHYKKYVSEEDAKKLFTAYNNVFKTGIPIEAVEWQMIRKDGTLGAGESSVSLMRDESNQPSGFCGIIRDITKRVRAANESKVITEIIQGVNTTTNLDELLKIVHQSIKKLLYAENCFVALYEKKTELLHMQFFVDQVDTVYPPQKLGKGLTSYVFRNGRPVLLTKEVIGQLTEQGEIEVVGTSPAIWLGIPLKTPTEVIGVLAVQHYEDQNVYNHRDLELLTTVGNQIALAIERKRSEDELRQSQEWLAAMFEASQDGIVVEENEHIVFVNKRYLQMSGYTDAAEVLRQHITNFQTPEDAARMVEYARMRLRGEKAPTSYEFKGLTKDGRELDVEASISTFTSNDKLYIVTAQRDITERKQAEEALRKETALVELLKTVAVAANESESIEDAIQICLNKVCQLMKWQYGHAALPVKDSPDELITMPLWYLDEQKRFEKVVREMKDVRFCKGVGLIGRVLESGKAIWIKDVTKDSSFTRGELAKDVGLKASFAFPILWQSKVLGVLTFFSEKIEDPDEKLLEVMISIGTQLGQAIARKQSEEALQISEERHRLLFESNPQPAFVYDLETFAIIAANEAAVRNYGYSREEFLSTITVKDIRPPEGIPDFLERVSKVSANHDVVLSPSRHQKKDGTVFDVEITSHVLDFAGRRAEIMLVNDVTERKRAEEAIRHSEEKYRTILETMQEGYFENDLTGKLTFVNDAYARIAGFNKDELLGLSYRKLVDEETAKRIFAIYNGVFTTGQSVSHFDYKVIRQDGTIKIHESSVSLIRNEANEPVGFRGLFRDITERKRIEEALALESSLMQALMDNIPDAIYFKDTQSRFVRVSKYVHLKGINSPEEAVGKTDFDFFPEEYARYAYEDEQRIVQTGQPLIDKEEKETFPDGTISWVLSTKVPIFNAEGKVTGIIGASRDITERKRIEEELERTRDAALESARLKSEFLANMSHEIRTPMNGVLGMTGLLLDTSLGAEQRDYAETIQSSADGLLRIIDDILDFSKIEAGQLHFETIDFDLNEAVEGAVELVAERARIKEIELASLIYQDVPTALQSDPGRLRQVLTNLIGNAIKFTEQGEVIVSVHKQSETEKYVLLRFEVKDTGIGISEEAQQKLFQAFVQADGSTTRKYGGTGLGLAISKQLVEMMGGEIGIKSELGKGSTFWFTARFEKQESPNLPLQMASEASLEGLRVLIVDDNQTNRRIFLHQTTSWGMRANEAESGEQALSVLRAAADTKEPFDIAILDLMMPEMDGFDLARQIKADAAISQTHLVILPSYGKRGHGQLARDLEIAAYLQKPVRQSQLYNCLSAIITEATASAETRQSPRLITQHTLGQASREKKVTVDSTVKVRILVAEDNIVNQKVALKQLQSLGYAADIVPNGREAIEAVKNHSYDVVLMDCQMPIADGFEATATIRQHEGEAKHTIIIAMTAHALEGEREKCLAAGMDDYISKPVKIDILGEMLKKWLARDAENLEEAQAEKLATTINMDNFESVDTAVLGGFKDLQQPDESDIVTELIDLFLEDAEKRMTVLKQSADGDDVKMISTQAHAIKGSSGNIGAVKIAMLSNLLEEKTIDISRARLIISELEAEFEKVARILKAMRKSDS